MLNEGKYPARLHTYGIREVEKGAIFFAVFSITETNSAAFVEWSATTWTEAAKKRGLEGLVDMGLKDNDLEKVRKGPDGGALRIDVPYTVTLAKKTWTNRKGEVQTTFEVKYINTPNDPKFQAAMSDKKSDLSSMTADLLQVRAEKGVPAKKDEFDPKL